MKRASFIGLVGLLLAGWLIYLLTPILSPFLIGVLLAYLGDPLVDRLERWKLSRTLAVVAVFALFSLILLAALLIVLPMLGKQLMHLYQLAPRALDWLQVSALPWLQAKLDSPGSFNRAHVSAQLLALERGDGPTYFDIVLQIIAAHPNVTLLTD